jgi:hypothetical protein
MDVNQQPHLLWVQLRVTLFAFSGMSLNPLDKDELQFPPCQIDSILVCRPLPITGENDDVRSLYADSCVAARREARVRQEYSTPRTSTSRRHCVLR